MNKDASRVIGWDIGKPGSDMTMYCIREGKNIRLLTPEQFKKFKRTLAFRNLKRKLQKRGNDMTRPTAIAHNTFNLPYAVQMFSGGAENDTWEDVLITRSAEKADDAFSRKSKETPSASWRLIQIIDER